MPLDYRILQQAPQPVQPNTLGSLGNILAVGKLMDQDRAAQQKADADRVLAQLSAQFANDPEKAIPELYRLGFTTQARELEDHVDKRKKALFEIRKSELDGDLTAGRISAEKAKAERDAMDATSPDKMAPFFAASENESDWQNAVALTRLKFGPNADAFIAQMGAFDPSKARFAGRVVMGPEKVAIDVDRDLTREQQAAQAATDDARADEALKATIAYQQGQLSNTRRGQDLTDKRVRDNAKLTGQGGGMTATAAAQIPPQARAVTARIVTGMPGTQTGPITQEVARLAAEGDEARLKSYLKYAATQKVGVAQRTAIQGRIETLTALKDAEALLKQVPTGFIRGTWENTMAALGKTSDPRLREIGTRMGVILSNYMRSISGAAVSDNEAKRLTPLIPNYKNDLSVNLATLKGFANTLKSFDKAFYQETFGQDYDWVMSSATSTGGGSGFSFLLPDGRRATFPTAAAMEAAKKAMGIK